MQIGHILNLRGSRDDDALLRGRSRVPFCGHVFSDWQLRVRIVYNAAVFVSSLNASLETKTDAKPETTGRKETSKLIYSWVYTCLVPIRRLSRPCRLMHFGDVSETNGRETETFSDHVTRNA